MTFIVMYVVIVGLTIPQLPGWAQQGVEGRAGEVGDGGGAGAVGRAEEPVGAVVCL